MVGGPIVNGQEDYHSSRINLATEGHRQPRFGLLSHSPSAVAAPARVQPRFGHRLQAAEPESCPNSGGKEHLTWIKNFGKPVLEDRSRLANATAVSDNSVFTQVGLAVGTKRVARMATAMGIALTWYQTTTR